MSRASGRALALSAGVALLPAAAGAQGPRVSATAGLSLASLSYPDTATYNSTRVGVSLQLVTEIPLAPAVALRVGAAVVERGVSALHDQVQLHFLELPLQVRVQGAPRDGVVAWAAVGAAPALQLRCRAFTEIFVNSAIGSGWHRQALPCDGRHDGNDVGLTASLGLRAPPGRLGWTAEVRYVHGMANLATASQAQRVYSRNVIVGVGVQWTRRGVPLRAPS